MAGDNLAETGSEHDWHAANDTKQQYSHSSGHFVDGDANSTVVNVGGNMQSSAHNMQENARTTYHVESHTEETSEKSTTETDGEMVPDGAERVTENCHSHLCESAESFADQYAQRKSPRSGSTCKQEVMTLAEAHQIFETLKHQAMQKTAAALEANSDYQQFPELFTKLVSEGNPVAHDMSHITNEQGKMPDDTVRHVANLGMLLQHYMEQQKPTKAFIEQLNHEIAAMQKWKESTLQQFHKVMQIAQEEQECTSSIEFDEAYLQELELQSNLVLADVSREMHLRRQVIEERAVRLVESSVALKGKHEAFQEDIRSKLDLTGRKLGYLWTRLNNVVGSHKVPLPPNLYGNRAIQGHGGFRPLPFLLQPPLPPLPPDDLQSRKPIPSSEAHP